MIHCGDEDALPSTKQTTGVDNKQLEVFVHILWTNQLSVPLSKGLAQPAKKKPPPTPDRNPPRTEVPKQIKTEEKKKKPSSPEGDPEECYVPVFLKRNLMPLLGVSLLSFRSRRASLTVSSATK